MKEIDTLSEDYVSGVREMNSGERTDHLKKIETAFSKSKEYVDDKVQLAMQTYEMVNMIQSSFYVVILGYNHMTKIP